MKLRDLVARARLALERLRVRALRVIPAPIVRLWRGNPVRLAAAIAAAAALAGLQIAESDILRALVVLGPFVVGVETARRNVWSPRSIIDGANALDHDTPAGGVAGVDRVD